MANTIPANNNTGLYNTANATPAPIGNTTYVNNLQASGNIKANGYISATGNITTDGYFVGNFAGNIVGNLTVPGSNTQVIYNNEGNAGASAGFTFNSNGNVLTVSGNVGAGAVKSDNYLYANGVPISFSGTYGNSNVAAYLPTYTGNIAAGNVSATGNIAATYVLGNAAFMSGIPASYGNSNVAAYLPTYTGNLAGSNLSVTGNITGNIQGTVANATYATTSGSATTAGTVTTNAQPNITSVGTLTTLSVSGNTTTGGVKTDNYYYANGAPINFGGTYGNSNVAAYLPTYTGNLAGGNANITGTTTTGNLSVTGNIYAPGSGSNPVVIGQVSAVTGEIFMASNSIAAGNSVSNAATILSISLPSAGTYQISTTVRATWADTGNQPKGAIFGLWDTTGTVVANSQVTVSVESPSITTALYWDSSASAVYNVTVAAAGTYTIRGWSSVSGGASFNSDEYGYTFARYTQLNPAFAISNVAYTGNISYAGNITATGNVIGSNILSNGIISSTGNISTAAQINGVNISAAGSVTVGTILTHGGSITGPNFSVSGGVTTTTSLNSGAVSVSGNVTGGNLLTGGAISAVGNITGNYIFGTIAGNVANATYATTAGTAYSVSGANVSGAVANATYATTSGTAYSVSGSNVSGAVANATYATTSGSATTAGTVTTAAQPNITSVGNLTSVVSTGNITGANILTGGLVSATGNVQGAYIKGDGSQLTNLPVQPGTYGNANVAAYLPTYTGNIAAGNISATGIITGANVVAANITSTGTLSSPNLQIDGDSVTVGSSADYTPHSVAVGFDAGSWNNLNTDYAVAVGYQAGGPTSEGANSVSIGAYAGYTNIGFGTVAVGYGAAGASGGANAVAIGYEAEVNGDNAISIGQFAGKGAGTQPNSIILNASGANLASTQSGLFINPVRNDTSNTTQAVFYNTTSKEVTYSTAYGDANVNSLLTSYNGYLSAGNLGVATNATVTGNVTAAYIASSGNIRSVGVTSAVGGVISGNVRLATVDGTAGQVLTTYGNGQTYFSTVSGGSYGDSNVNTLLASWGSNSLSTTGNVTAGNLNLSGQIYDSAGVLQLNGSGNIVLVPTGITQAYGDMSVTGNIIPAGIKTDGYYYANGTPVSFGGGSYGNSNVATFLAAYGSNVVSTTGNVTAGYFIGDGSLLTNLPAGNYSNANVASFLGAFGSNTISTTGTITSGNITATNIGNIAALNLNGNSSQVLYGNGVFAAVAGGGGGSPGGSDTQIQFNDGGSFAGNSLMTFDKTSGNITLGNVLYNGTYVLPGNMQPNLSAYTQASNPYRQFIGSGYYGNTNITNFVSLNAGNSITGFGAGSRMIQSDGWTVNNTAGRLSGAAYMNWATFNANISNTSLATAGYGITNSFVVGGGPTGNTYMVPNGLNIASMTTAMQVGAGTNTNLSAVGNTTVMHALGFSSGVSASLYSNIQYAVGLRSSVSWVATGGNYGNTGTSSGICIVSNMTGSNFTDPGTVQSGNVAHFYIPGFNSSTTINPSYQTGNICRMATNYHAFRNDDDLAQVKLGRLSSFNEARYISGTTSGSLTIDKANGQVQEVVLAGAVTSVTFSNFVAQIIRPDSSYVQTTDTVTIIFRQGATGYAVTMPTGTAYKYAGGSNTIGTTANSVTMVSVTGVYNSTAAATEYLITISPEFV